LRLAAHQNFKGRLAGNDGLVLDSSFAMALLKSPLRSNVLTTDSHRMNAFANAIGEIPGT
jgi:hypothetical protein